MNRQEIITSPSGATVEIKQKGSVVTTVYQLDENNERIKERKVDGRMDYLLGLIETDQLTNKVH